jgi:hypothetical protein
VSYIGNKVISIDPVPPPILFIRTTYGPKVSSKTKSSYGRGTTPEDIQAGNVTLGFHEGSHGTEAIQYIQNNPVPSFEGWVGMSAAEYRQACKIYNQEMDEYRLDLEKTNIEGVDCVGTKAEFCEEAEE